MNEWPDRSQARQERRPQPADHDYQEVSAVELARAASEAVRSLNQATRYVEGCPGLRYPSDAYRLLAELEQLVDRLPQLLRQTSAFLQRQLQHGRVAVEGGEFAGDPFGAIGTASHRLDDAATVAARSLSSALCDAREAIAYASYAGPEA